MTTSRVLPPTCPNLDPLHLTVAGYLARYKGQSRDHVHSDLRASSPGAPTTSLAPLAATGRRSSSTCDGCKKSSSYKPSTVSRRLSVIVGFYRTCVIDDILEHSPADYVRRPTRPAESPTLGLSHLQFEAMLTAARDSTNPYDFALVTMLGLLGLRIFEATGASIEDLSDSHGHRVLRVHGKGDKVVLIALPPAVARAIDRATADRTDGPILLSRTGNRMDRHAATRRLRALAGPAGIQLPRMHPHMLRHTYVTTMLDAGVRPPRRPDRRPPRRPAHHHALRPSPQEPRPTPQLHPRRLHGLRNLTRPRPQPPRLLMFNGRSAVITERAGSGHGAVPDSRRWRGGPSGSRGLVGVRPCGCAPPRTRVPGHPTGKRKIHGKDGLADPFRRLRSADIDSDRSSAAR